jgi:hypothetical protein
MTSHGGLKKSCFTAVGDARGLGIIAKCKHGRAPEKNRGASKEQTPYETEAVSSFRNGSTR